MDNGWSDKGKKSPNLESVGFLGHACRLPRQNPFMLKKNLTVANTTTGISKFHQKIRRLHLMEINKNFIFTKCQQKSFLIKSVKS